MQLVIDRTKWLRGEGSADSYLLRPTDGKMCCLGFFGLACGLEPERLTDVNTPTNIPISWETPWGVWTQTLPEADFLFVGSSNNSVACANLMNVNDDEELSEQEREKEIISLFAQAGIQVSFIN